MSKSHGSLMMAFDCLEGGSSVKSALASANLFAKRAGWSSRAVSVMSPDQLNWPGDFDSNWRAEFEKLGGKVLSKLLAHNKSKPDLPSKILFQPYHSRSGTVRTIVAEADRSGAEAIAVFSNTHESRFSIPGSFVNSIISHSRVPVFVINAKAPALKSIDTVLFATDFSATDSRTFNKIVQLAAKLQSRLVLIHVMPNLVNEAMASYAGITGGWNNMEFYLGEEEENMRKKSERWIAKAKKNGVDASYELIRNSSAIATSVMKAAVRLKADVIVVTEKTGPWAAVLLGSVTRKVLNEAATSVLVMPARAARMTGNS